MVCTETECTAVPGLAAQGSIDIVGAGDSCMGGDRIRTVRGGERDRGRGDGESSCLDHGDEDRCHGYGVAGGNAGESVRKRGCRVWGVGVGWDPEPPPMDRSLRHPASPRGESFILWFAATDEGDAERV